MSEKTEIKSPLTEDQEKQIVAQVVIQKQRDAFVAAISAVVGAQAPTEAKRLKKLATDAVAAAKKRGVEGPFLAEGERETIYNNNMQQLHQAHVEQSFRAEAGEEGADPDRIHELMVKLNDFDWKKAI